MDNLVSLDSKYPRPMARSPLSVSVLLIIVLHIRF